MGAWAAPAAKSPQHPRDVVLHFPANHAKGSAEIETQEPDDDPLPRH